MRVKSDITRLFMPSRGTLTRLWYRYPKHRSNHFQPTSGRPIMPTTANVFYIREHNSRHKPTRASSTLCNIPECRWTTGKLVWCHLRGNGHRAGGYIVGVILTAKYWRLPTLLCQVSRMSPIHQWGTVRFNDNIVLSVESKWEPDQGKPTSS